MVAAIEGLSYSELMNLHMDEFIEIRSNVVQICDKREQKMRASQRG